ncbi:hypothetical protein M0R45_036589 [Rubus argutus]|uniref:F-box domain-containing protein n=1 Tax=Rubus argutus TaxID=59490 RepID=A0AAW1W1P1_RUBAR
MDHGGIIATVEGESKNWIDELPDCVLSSILSFLRTRDAVETSMVSHLWRDLWKPPILMRPSLEFDIPNILGGKYAGLVEEHEEYNCLPLLIDNFDRQCFVRRVNELLELYSGNKVDSLKVAFFFDGEYTAILDKWIHFAITKGAQVLDLQLFQNGLFESENYYVFPHWLLSDLNVSTLKHLSLQICVLKPPTDFDRFLQLTTLCLNKVIVDPVFMAHLFSVCVLLESLSLCNCQVRSNLIVGPSLCLSDLKVLVCGYLERIEIHAVNLSSLEYDGDIFKISCMRTPQLFRRHLETSSNLTWISSCYILIELGNVVNFIKVAPLLEELVITTRASNYQGEMRNLSGFAHNHLRKIKMQGVQGKWYEIELAICILKIATKLEVMVIDPFGKYYGGGGRWTTINSCYYYEGNDDEAEGNGVSAEERSEHEKVEEGIEDEVVDLKKVDEEDVDDFEFFFWQRTGRAVVRARLKEVKANAQIIIL